MLAEVQKIGTLTLFPHPKKDNTGWKVEVIRGGNVVKTSYALSEDEAKLIRGMWINQFWGNQIN